MKKLLPLIILTICILQQSVFGQGSLLNGSLSLNGAVNAQHVVGNTLYIGGNFTAINANSGPLVGVDGATGNVASIGLPAVSGTVNTIAFDATYGYLIGGSFTSVGGQTRTNLARLNTNLSVHALNISVPGIVNKIVIYSGKAYVFGSFGGMRIDLVNNSLDTWGIQYTSGDVKDAEIDNGFLYIVGNFKPASGSNNCIAKYDLSNNGSLITSWTPFISSSSNTSLPNNAIIYDLLIANGVIYFGGSGISYTSGGVRSNFAAITVSGSAVSGLNVQFNNTVYSLAYTTSSSVNYVIIGGAFAGARLGSTGNFGNRNKLVMVNLNNNQFLPWYPNPDGNVNALTFIGGNLLVGGDFTEIGANTAISRFAVYSGLPSAPVLEAIALNPNGSPKVFISGSGTNIIAGGNFSQVKGYVRNRVAAIDITTGLPTAFNTSVDDGEVFAIHVSGYNVYLGGSFTSVNGLYKNHFVTVNNLGVINTNIYASFNSTVRSILEDGTNLYVGGDFRSVSVPATLQQVNVNFLTVLDFSTGTAAINAAFNASLDNSVDLYGVKVIRKLSTGYLYAGGRFSTPRNALICLNPSTGAAISGFNANIASSINLPEVSDITQVNATKISIAGNFPSGFNSSSYSSDGLINYSSGSIGGVAVMDANSGNLTLRNQGFTNPTGWSHTPSSILKGVNNFVYYTNSAGLFMTSLTDGGTSPIYNNANNPILSLAASGSMFFMGGDYSLNINSTLFNNFSAIDFVTPLAPTVSSGTLAFSAINNNSMTLNWSAGNGSRRIVLARQGSTVTNNPSDGYNYSANSSFNSGSAINGAYVIYDGVGSTVNLTNLQISTDYYFRIVEYNGSGAFTVYENNFLSGTAATTTISAPVNPAANINFSTVGLNSMNVNWTRGSDGNQCMVVVRQGTAVNELPANNISYNFNANFGNGDLLGTMVNANYVVYKGTGSSFTLSNLSPTTTYYVAVFEFNITGAIIKYLTSSYATGNATTNGLASTPTIAASGITFQNLGSSVTRVNWTNGNGNKRLLLAYSGKLSPVTNVGATNGSGYVANSNYSSFSPAPGSIDLFNVSINYGPAKVVYNGTGTTALVSGLLSSSFYTYVVVEYNDISGNPTTSNYLKSSILFGSKETDASIQAPTINASNIGSIASNASIRLNWINGNGSNRLIVARQAGVVSWSPVSNVNYISNGNFNSATDLGSGNKVVYSGTGNSATISGLSAYTNYYFTIYEFNSVYNNGTLMQEYAYNTNNPASYIGKTAALNWPRTGGGIDRDAAGGVAVDGSGNVYVAGTFKGNSNWGLTEVTGSGNDIFLAKYNSVGDILWIINAGSTEDDAAAAVVLDGSGNPYITGSFRTSATFGSTTIVSAGSDDAFVAKYNTTGSLQWVQRIGGTGQDVGNAITIDASGNIIVGGYITGTITFSNSTTTLTSTGQSDLLVAKYSSSGTFLWAKKGGSTGYDFAFGVATDQNSNVFVTGEIKGISTFGTATTSYNALADVVLVKYDSSGVVQYANAYGSSGDDQGYGIAIDANGQVYLSGAFSNTIVFGTTTLASAGVTDGFITKITGATGSALWAKKQGGLAQDAATGLSIGTNGDIFVVGTFGGVASFDSQTLTSAGNLDVFTAIYTNTGVLNQAQKFGGPLDDAAKGIYAMTPSNSYITGYFNGTANFGGFDVKARIGSSSNGGDWDLFVHNLGATYNNDPSADLVAWFRMNGNANDFSGNGYNGTVVSSASNSVNIINDRNVTVNSAYEFSGTGRIDFQIPSNSVLNNLNQLTVMAWINVNSFSGMNYEDRSIISTDETDGKSFNLLVTKDQGLFGSIFDVNSNTIGAGVSNTNYVYAPTGTWAHVALTYENGVQSCVFYNGNNAGTVAAFSNSTFNLSNRRYTIGAQGASSGSVFSNFYSMNGDIDDVRIYKRALTAVQIQDIMNATSALSIPPPQESPATISSKLKSGIIWPNPSNGLFNLEIENEEPCGISFAITDISGKTVLSEPCKLFESGSFIKTFDLDGIQSGYYFLQVMKGGVTSTHKLILTK
ncbi:MAG: T9SS type A sorting domain-containing protein [Bacteroidia bacterium]|nr:T9SS type A sorting domain-containing protein [Bacteroidia bacterium]